MGCLVACYASSAQFLRQVAAVRPLPGHTDWRVTGCEYDPDLGRTAVCGYSGEAGRVFRSYSATQNDSGRPPAKGYVRQP